jgi:hypothetical protein
MVNVSSWKRSAAPLFFFVDSLMSQAIGAALVVIAWRISGDLTTSLFLGTISASAMSLFFALPLPWQLLNLVIIPATALSLSVQLPGWVFFALLAFTVLIYAPAFWTRVPYYPTSTPTYLMLLAELPRDLGCGFGDLLLFLAKHSPQGRYVGVEIGVLPFLVAKVRAAVFGRGRVSIQCKSMWSVKLSEFDVVYTFLSPAPMVRVWEKVVQEMRSGSLFITNSFAVPDDSTRAIHVKDERQSTLFIHQR